MTSDLSRRAILCLVLSLLLTWVCPPIEQADDNASAVETTSRGDKDVHEFLIEVRRESDRLIGRYVNLRDPDDHSPWVGLIVRNERIDGQWSDGPWDFRRGTLPEPAAE